MRALDAIRATVAIVIGAAIGWVAASLYSDLVALPAAKEAGRIEERLKQEKDRRQAEAKAAADQKARQVEFAAIEAGYLQREAERSDQLAKLEQALQDKPDDPPPTGGAVCRVLIPGRVSDQLNRTGRAAVSPAFPAKPDPSLPPGR